MERGKDFFLGIRAYKGIRLEEKEAPLINMRISDGFRKNVSEKGYSSLEKKTNIYM